VSGSQEGRRAGGVGDGSGDGHPSGSGEPPVGIDELLERVRGGYERIEAREAYDAVRSGDALLVDIRYAALRERDGLIPGALVVERNELEWRLDPRGSHRTPEATGHGSRSACRGDLQRGLRLQSRGRLPARAGAAPGHGPGGRVPGVEGVRVAGHVVDGGPQTVSEPKAISGTR
jgi:hypothetical protein